MSLTIRKYPDPILLTPTRGVSSISQDVIELIHDLKAAEEKPPWGAASGMAANQIGSSLRVMVALKTAYINPVIEKYFGKRTVKKEGCFSLDKGRFDYPVIRAHSIILRWITIEGTLCRKRFHGYEAQVIQHECEHLDGVLCYNPALQKEKRELEPA